MNIDYNVIQKLLNEQAEHRAKINLIPFDGSKWGIIDRNGNWVLQPKLEGIGPDCSDDRMFAYYDEDP